MKALFEYISVPTHCSFDAFRIEEKKFDCPFHYHPEIEITLIESSHGFRLIGDNLAPFQGGDLCLIGSNLAHMYYNSGLPTKGKQAHAEVIQFDLNIFADLLE